ncbi:MAG: glycosyltransferase family 2 protein [Alphaproteobacteria bacterium]|nr:glycosyltransferase family 2 protein [Alphaproteobacteria bacterium]MCL2758308.1 glycosyltransferase family 2 protein [Alphaproteobacteria bacterium]
MTPKISIILPVYNAGKYLADALESVKNQTYTDWECVCVNDGSTDGSESVIAEFVKHDKRFVLVNQSNGGVSSARNAGLDAARGEFIAFLDHDDLLTPGALEHFMRLADAYNADMVRVRCTKIPEKFQLASAGKFFNPRPRVEFYAENPHIAFIKNDRKQRRNDTWCWVWLCMFRATAIKGIRFPKDLRAGGEDNVFMLEAIDRVRNYVQSNAIKYLHRRSAISTTLNKKVMPISLVERFIYGMPILAAFSRKCRRSEWCEYIYRKETRRMYKTLVRNVVRKNQHIERSREVLGQIIDTPVFRPEYLNIKSRAYLRLFMNGHVRLLKIITRMI